MSFESMTKRAIDAHGVLVTYCVTTNGTYDPVTSELQSTEVRKQIKAYPKHIRATAYNFPSLVGKDSVMFYIVPGIVTPSIKDSIEYNSGTYIVDSFQSHIAEGQILLYKVIAVKA